MSFLNGTETHKHGEAGGGGLLISTVKTDRQKREKVRSLRAFLSFPVRVIDSAKVDVSHNTSLSEHKKKGAADH